MPSVKPRKLTPVRRSCAVGHHTGTTSDRWPRPGVSLLVSAFHGFVVGLGEDRQLAPLGHETDLTGRERVGQLIASAYEAIYLSEGLPHGEVKLRRAGIP